ncbi:MAG: hypothetical protein HYT81_11420 [Gemmatimonadetes bacterium]|nr:hypothetical protein [Gemmatimonadota bacterium]
MVLQQDRDAWESSVQRAGVHREAEALMMHNVRATGRYRLRQAQWPAGGEAICHAVSLEPCRARSGLHHLDVHSGSCQRGGDIGQRGPRDEDTLNVVAARRPMAVQVHHAEHAD